ncbi:MAG: rod shape-determining protein RodA [Bacteroidetes bacterium RIFCSPLOWO2_02_FULL_36_8]|nr:MAG: rod shape-determining protein RodA [Bacteroidetes bacterium RIFCSPLOWO2_02_FULL_36_8]OFY72110.1 MAG: rod shape-determining protein RodA [Bacteroidetes bacterium RIFCSPLOWO2_12_FULL_37_12]
MSKHSTIKVGTIDWLAVIFYMALVVSGWLSIYASVYDMETGKSIFDIQTNSGRQFLWMLVSWLIIIPIITVDYKLFDSLAYLLYILTLVILVLVIFFGTEIRGSHSWITVFGFRFQPLELAKITTSLTIARYLSKYDTKIGLMKSQIILFSLIGIPALLIIGGGETGSALVFAAFVFVFYREGMSGNILLFAFLFIILFGLTLMLNIYYLLAGLGVITFIIGILLRKNKNALIFIITAGIISMGIVLSENYLLHHVLKPHQIRRLETLVNPNADPLGMGWNVTQSKIAIGSGGFLGKGFLEGTQTKFDFVPEQSTDFIFCTIAEEKGFTGSIIIIGLFVALFIRIILIAERQKSAFSRIYAYCVLSVLFFHFAINIAMTLGLAPVIGIPLPFISYGGSSLVGFTMLFFIMLKLDAYQGFILR